MSWTWFKRWGLVEQKTLPQLEKEWADLTAGADTHAIWHKEREQWLVPSFKGITKSRVKIAEQSQDVTRTAAIGGSGQLEQLHGQGQALLNQCFDSIRPAPQVLESQPATDASLAEQPSTPAPSDLMLQQSHREA